MDISKSNNYIYNIVFAILDNEKSRKNNDKEGELKSFEEYSKCFIKIFGYPPTSDDEINITTTKLIKIYGRKITEAQLAQIHALSMLNSAHVQTLSRKYDNKLTIEYLSPSPELIKKLKNKQTEYVPKEDDIQKYQLNAIQLEQRFLDIADHIKLYEKLMITITKHKRAQTNPKSFSGIYTPVYLSRTFIDWFKDPKVSSVLEVTNEKLFSLLCKGAETGETWKLHGLNNGYAMKSTMISALYNYLKVYKLFYILNINGVKTIGVLFDDTLYKYFNIVFDQLVTKGKAYNNVDLKFTKSLGETIITMKEKNPSEELSSYIRRTKKCRFLPNSYITTLINLCIADAHTYQDQQTNEIVRVNDGKMVKVEITKNVEENLLADLQHMRRMKELLKNDKITEDMIQFSILQK